mmetsp:Transcript_3023/g.4671  ORF Transcript_3023/g.4671 Transcript_3023/m.4671 type:complete len:113 (-) Transcript_3023:220-558(-)
MKNKNYIDIGLIDTSSKDQNKNHRALSYPDADVFVVAFSVTDPASFVNVRQKWVPELKQYEPDVPRILVGTKTDLKRANLLIEPISKKQGGSLATEIDAMSLPTRESGNFVG